MVVRVTSSCHQKRRTIGATPCPVHKLACRELNQPTARTPLRDRGRCHQPNPPALVRSRARAHPRAHATASAQHGAPSLTRTRSRAHHEPRGTTEPVTSRAPTWLFDRALAVLRVRTRLLLGRRRGSLGRDCRSGTRPSRRRSPPGGCRPPGGMRRVRKRGAVAHNQSPA